MRILNDGINLKVDKKMCESSDSKTLKGVLTLVDNETYKPILDAFGKPLFTKENVVTITGRNFILQKAFGVEPKFKTDDLNTVMGIATGGVNPPIEKTNVVLFGVGTGGATETIANVKPTSTKQRELAEMVPFRVAQKATLDGPDAGKYYFRKALEDGWYAWYLKEFEKAVEIKTLFKDGVDGKDGSEVPANIHTNTSNIPIETFGESIIKISIKDIKEWFEKNGMIDKSRFNTLGLFMGSKTDVGGYVDYKNVGLFSVLNFDNEMMKEQKDITYSYRVHVL